MCLNRLGRLEIPGAVPGPPGPAGNQGPAGPNGPNGIGWIFGQGNPTNGPQSTPNGTLYLNTLASHVWVFDATTTQWTFVDSLQGNQGVPGQQGNTGPAGTSILSRYSLANANITSNNQTVLLNSPGYTAAGNTLVGDDGDIAKIYVETSFYAPSLAAVAYPHIINVNLNSISVTNPTFPYTSTNHPLYFVPDGNGGASVIYFNAFVEVIIQRNGIAPGVPNIFVRWGNSLNNSGYFRSNVSSSLDFSNPITIDISLVSAPSGAYSNSRVSSNGWIEIYKTI